MSSDHVRNINEQSKPKVSNSSVDVIILEEENHASKNDTCRPMLFPLISHVSQLCENEIICEKPIPFSYNCALDTSDFIDKEWTKCSSLQISNYSDVVKEAKKIMCEHFARDCFDSSVEAAFDSSSKQSKLPNSGDKRKCGTSYCLRKRKRKVQQEEDSGVRKAKLKRKMSRDTFESEKSKSFRNEDNEDLSNLTDWCEKYKPKCSSEVVGNSASVLSLTEWLKNWVRRSATESAMEKAKPKSKRKPGDSDDDYEEEDSDNLSRCVLLSGPPGIGKTSMVYAVAEQLGFKVFEVNASSRRSGKQLLNQLQEATQSHHVNLDSLPLQSFLQRVAEKTGFPTPSEQSKKNTGTKNTSLSSDKNKKKNRKGSLQYFFDNQKLKSQKEDPKKNAQISKSPLESAKNPSPDLVVLSDEEPQETLKNKNAKMSEKQNGQRTISSMFKKINKNTDNVKSYEISAASDLDYKTGAKCSKFEEEAKDLQLTTVKGSRRPSSEQNKANFLGAPKTKKNDDGIQVLEDKMREKCSKKEGASIAGSSDVICETGVGISSLSLILLDDVDVIFDEDDGFWSAVNTLIEITKKPIILTATTGIFHIKSALNCYIPEIHLDRPDASAVEMQLSQVYLKETVKDLGSSCNVKFMVDWFRGDIRRCMRQLQFWAWKPKLQNAVTDQKSSDCSVTSNALCKLLNCLKKSCFNVKEIAKIFDVITEKKLTKSCELNFNCKMCGFEAFWTCFDCILNQIPFGSSVNNADVQEQNAKESDKDSAARSVTVLEIVSDFIDDISYAESVENMARNELPSSSPEKRLRTASKPFEPDDRCRSIKIASNIEVFSFYRMLNKIKLVHKDFNLCTDSFEEHSFANLVNDEELRVRKSQIETSDVLPVVHRVNAKSTHFEYFAVLRTICKLEALRRAKNDTKTRRFQHYLDHLAFPIDSSMLSYLSTQLKM